MNIIGKWNKNSYKIIKTIGRGSFGKVYKAQNSKGNIVAIKISKELLSLSNEYNGLLEFKNMDFVPKVYDFDDWENKGEIWHFIVMDYILGENLKEISKNNKLNTRHIFKIGLRLLYIIKEINSQGFKYTDMKLENIILTKAGDIYLIDYGSLIEKDKPTKEYTQVYNVNSWNVKHKYSLEKSILFSINMVLINLVGNFEYNPIQYTLEELVANVQKFPINKRERNFLLKGLRGKFKNFTQYEKALKGLLTKRKPNRPLDKIDYILIFSIVSFVFVFVMSLKRIFILY